MSEKRFEVINARWQGKGEAVAFEDTQTNQVYFAENQEECERIVDCLNEQQATIQSLKERLYDFEKRKIIEESEIDEDVIPKVKLLRTELFGEKYE